MSKYLYAGFGICVFGFTIWIFALRAENAGLEADNHGLRIALDTAAAANKNNDETMGRVIVRCEEQKAALSEALKKERDARNAALGIIEALGRQKPLPPASVAVECYIGGEDNIIKELRNENK
jgi:hypothetical protein